MIEHIHTRTSRIRNLLWALGITLAFAAVVSSALLTRVEDVHDTPMSTPQAGWHLYPSYLLETAGPLPPVHVIWLRPDNLAAYIRSPELKIYFSTYAGHATITTATIEALGTDCVYDTPGAAQIGDLALVRFVRREGCSPLRGAPTGDLKLTVHLADRQRIGVSTFVPIASRRDQGPDSIRVITPSAETDGMHPVLRGYYVDYLAPTSTRRIDLLRYMWQFPRAAWIWQIVGLACGLLFVSAGVILSLHVPGDGKLWRLAGRASLGFGCGAAALGLMYAVLVPPLQAPDEPDHLLSYSRLLDDRQLENSLMSWAQLVHFDRIRFHADERFRPADIGRPFPVAWKNQIFDEISGEDVRARSMTTTAWWNTLSGLVQHASLPRRLLLLRFANVLLFALSVAIAAALLMVIAHGTAPRPELLGVVFLLVPSLPFFAMHVSEFSVVTSAYVLFAACVLAMFIGGSRASWVGGPLGLVIALLLASGRSTLPMAPVIATLLCIRVALGEPGSGPETTRRGPAIFWTGFGVVLCSSASLVAPTYVSPDPIHQVAADTVLPWLRTLWQPWVLLLMAAGGWLLELAVGRLRRVVRSSARHFSAEAVRLASFSFAAAILVSLVWSLFARFPQLEPLEAGHSPSEAHYVVNVLRVAGSWARATAPDHLLSTSFWAGFGWLEAIPGAALINMLTAGAALLLALLLVEIGSRRDTRRFVALVLLAIGMTAAIAAYALATYAMQRNLHGRYLIGVYLTGLVIAFSPLALARFDILTKHRMPCATIMFATVAAIHAYCLSFVLHRYF